MLISRNDIIQGKHNKPILLDIGYKANGIKKPIIVFAHGFKGFKDWGHFNKVMEYFIEKDYAFVKFNFSHNGGTIENPIDFPDLEAFGNNNYSKEIDDLTIVLDWIDTNESIPVKELDKQQIYLIGHSRGGGVSILVASNDARIKRLVTWASVSDFIKRLPQDQIQQWKEEGVIHVANARTNQQMPMYYQFAQDVIQHKDKLDIKRATKSLTIPHLIIHGTEDEAVGVNEAQQLHQWNSSSELLLIKGAGHTFGAKHPYADEVFPDGVQQVLENTLQFFQK